MSTIALAETVSAINLNQPGTYLAPGLEPAGRPAG